MELASQDVNTIWEESEDAPLDEEETFINWIEIFNLAFSPLSIPSTRTYARCSIRREM